MGHATRVSELLSLGVLMLAACSSPPAQQPSFPIAMTGGPAVTGQAPGVTPPTNTTPSTNAPPVAVPAGAAGAMTPGAAGSAPLTPSSPQMDPVIAPVGGAGMPAAPSIPPVVEPEYKDGKLEGMCPDGFMPRAGMNTGFTSDGKQRDFLVYLPDDMSTPRPVFVGITGTEQQSDAFISAGQLNSLTREGWIVLAPVRLCTSENRQQECLMGVGQSTMQGWVWEPWNDGSMQDMWNTDAGPDVRYLENMVRCVAKQWQVDNRRIFLGGISAGGSFTNRNLTFNSKFWAGGVPASGMWYIAAGNDSVNASNADQIMDGWCCHRPASEIRMYSSIVIVLFGGDMDQYTTRGDNPVTVQYKSEAQASSNVYDAQDNVAVVNCRGTQGHLWPRSAAWNSWMAKTLASHPKGSKKADFKLTTPPAGFQCKLGRFTDIF